MPRTAPSDPRNRVARKAALFDRSQWEPEYQRGVDTANALIAQKADPGRVDFALGLVMNQMVNWREPGPGKPNCMSDAQYAMVRGFGETLYEYRQEQGS